MPDRLTSADFSAWEYTPFGLALDDGAVLSLTLIEVRELPHRHELQADERAPFSLVFQGPEEPALPQRIYRLEHEHFDALDLFLVPIGHNEEGPLYESVFS